MLKRLLTLIALILVIGLTVAACAKSTTDAGMSAIADPEKSDSIGAAALPHHGDGVEGVAELHEDEPEEVGHHAVEPIGHHDDEHESAIVPEAREVTLIASEWEFAPAVIHARVGDPVTIVLVNDGAVEHDVEVAAFGLHLHTPTGESLKGSFVPDRAGVFEFACEIPGHRAAGMVGTLVVTE